MGRRLSGTERKRRHGGRNVVAVVLVSSNGWDGTTDRRTTWGFELFDLEDDAELWTKVLVLDKAHLRGVQL